MKTKAFVYWLFIVFILGTFQITMATKLVEVKVLDKDYLMVYFIDGEVTYVDDGVGDCAYTNGCHDESNDNLVSYGTGLNTSQAVNNSNWKITSGDDANYGTSGHSPANCYRKSKLNGMTENQWNDGIGDYEYDYTMEHCIFLYLPESMVQGNSYTLTINANTNTDVTSQSFTFDIFNSRSEAVHVNLVGYSSSPGIKAADLYQWMGNGEARDYSNFVGNKVYIYNVNTLQSQEVGTVTFGQTSQDEIFEYNLSQSDVFNADFTGFNQEGTYRLAIEGVGCSQDFQIDGSIYYTPFKVSTLGFFYMRIGQDNLDMTPVPRRPLWIPNESPSNTRVYITTMHPYHADWEDLTEGDNWDNANAWAPYVKSGNPQNSDAWGGHSDALDWDRHLGHIIIIYDMLLPYFLTNGALSNDNLGIAESGNGIPDIIDEARNEADFWLRLRDGKAYSHGLTNPNNNNIFYQAGTHAIAAWASAANCAMLSNCLQIAGLNELANTYRDSSIAAYNYAGQLSDQMLNTEHGIGDFIIRGRDLKMMAAAYLYNVTGNTIYEDAVNIESVAIADNSEIISVGYNQVYATAAYLKTRRDVHYTALFNRMKASIIYDAKQSEANYSLSRPSRRATDNYITWYFKTAQNVQRTMVAHSVADVAADKELFENALILEADYGLGRNSLNMIQMTTASTSLASKRSVENCYTTGRDDGTPGMHPGHTPYFNLDDWYACDMVMGCPAWLTDKCYPDISGWPMSEGYFNTPYVWAHSEFTPQQTMNGKAALYGYLYGLDEHSYSSFKINTVKQSDQRLEIFPNPASSEITVILPAKITKASLIIFDMNGRLIETKELTDNTIRIETKELARGIYIVKAVLEEQTLIDKLIIR